MTLLFFKTVFGLFVLQTILRTSRLLRRFYETDIIRIFFRTIFIFHLPLILIILPERVVQWVCLQGMALVLKMLDFLEFISVPQKLLFLLFSQNAPKYFIFEGRRRIIFSWRENAIANDFPRRPPEIHFFILIKEGVAFNFLAVFRTFQDFQTSISGLSFRHFIVDNLLWQQSSLTPHDI